MEYSYNGDPGKCHGCGKTIPNEDAPYCMACENAMAGIDTDSDYGGDYDD